METPKWQFLKVDSTESSILFMDKLPHDPAYQKSADCGSLPDLGILTLSLQTLNPFVTPWTPWLGVSEYGYDSLPLGMVFRAIRV